jgi:hypothetical protein
MVSPGEELPASLGSKVAPFSRQTWTTVSPFWTSRTASLWSVWVRDLP